MILDICLQPVDTIEFKDMNQSMMSSAEFDFGFMFLCTPVNIKVFVLDMCLVFGLTRCKQFL
jgi:hypothetical protein